MSCKNADDDTAVYSKAEGSKKTERRNDDNLFGEHRAEPTIRSISHSPPLLKLEAGRLCDCGWRS